MRQVVSQPEGCDVILTASDPRAARSRTAMLDAAVRLLAEGGMAAVTHQAVAAEAGVGRATVYRHWPRPMDLIVAALDAGTWPVFEVAAGNVRDELLAQFNRRLEWLNQPIADAVVAALIDRGRSEPDIGQVRDATFGGPAALVAAAIDVAVDRGELAPQTPSGTVASLIIGAILFQRHMLGVTITPELVEDIVDTALRGWLAPRSMIRPD